ncbi:MAG: P-loop NTPase fold protein [Solirubrobacteraceae bacterium]
MEDLDIPPVALSADTPITTAADDRLGRTTLALRIAKEAVTAPQDSGFVIGLCGEWGSGKSSIANLVQEQLATDERAVVVRFDPWYFSGTEDLLGLFFTELATALGKRDRLKRVAAKVRGYGSVLSSIAGVVPVAGGTVAGVVKAAGAAADLVAQAATLEERRSELSDALKEFAGRIVVIIDDVDRLADSEVVEIVRLAKLVGDLPRMTYVLCFDRDRVEEILGGGRSPESRDRGRAYMEKIVQSRFDVPPVRPYVLVQVMVDELNQLLRTYPLRPPPQDDWMNLLNFGIRPLLRVPRDAKRFANAIPAAVELLADEVAFVDLLALEALRIFEPDVHRGLPQVADVLVGGSSLVIPQENQQRIDALLADARRPDAVNAILGRAFPNSRVKLPNPRVAADRRVERREKRVSQPGPFFAYLYVTLDEDVVASADVERIVELFADPAALSDELEKLSDERLPDLLDRVLDHDLRVERIDIVPVVLAFVALHERPSPDPTAAVLSGRAPLEWQLHLLVRAFLDQAPSDQRAEIARELFGEAPDLSSKLLMLGIVATWPEEDGGQVGVLDAEETEGLAHELAQATLAAQPADLASERLAARLLASAQKHGDPAEIPRINEMIADSALLLSVLVQSMVYGRSAGTSGAAEHLISKVRWHQLISIFDEATLRVRVEELDHAVDRGVLKAADLQALDAVLRIIRGEEAPDPDL